MIQDFVVVSAYTKNTNYENIIKNLKQDCLNLNIPNYFIGYGSTGSWVENTMLKPQLLLSVWKELSLFYKNLIWIDADARIMLPPKYFSELSNDNIDFSVFQMGSISRVTSGTIFIKMTEAMRIFINEWKNLCEVTDDRKGDQQCLRNLISCGMYDKLNIKYKPLPYAYCYIFDDVLRKLEPNIPPLTESPVVVHMQASRDRNNAKQK